MCSNYFSLACEFNNLPKHVETILIELTPDVLIKDHTTFENIENVINTHNQLNPTTKMLMVGDQGLKQIYGSHRSTKILDVEAQMLASVG